MDPARVRSDRRTAAIIGVLFILGTVAGALSLVVTDPLLAAPDDVARIAAHPHQLLIGVLLLLTMAFALALVPVVFWPVGRRHNEALSMGYVVFRGALETVTYIAGACGWLILVEFSAHPALPGAVAGYVQTAEALLWDQVIAIPFAIGALMFYSVLFQARLVPRWISAWGLIGAVFYIAAPLAAMFDVAWGFLMAPLAVQEMVMAVWLIAKGFSVPDATRSAPVVAPTARTLTLTSHLPRPSPWAAPLPGRLPKCESRTTETCRRRSSARTQCANPVQPLFTSTSR